MLSARTYSVNEASYLAGLAAKEVNREYDTGGVFRAAGAPTSVSAQKRLVTLKHARYLCLISLQKDLYSKEGRLKIYKVIDRLPLATKTFDVGAASFDLTPVDAQIEARTERLTDLKTRIIARDGDAVFANRETSAYRVAALAKAQTVDEILEDYPSLTREMVQDAIDYETAYPKQGRPYPSRSLKRSLKDLAAAGAFAHLSSDDSEDAA